MKAQERPLWRCPECGHTFVTRNLWHSCGRDTLDPHFADKPALVRERRVGPFEVEPQKTRIVFQPSLIERLGRAYRIGCQEHLREKWR
jgi:hypothetical protein